MLMPTGVTPNICPATITPGIPQGEVEIGGMTDDYGKPCGD